MRVRVLALDAPRTSRTLKKRRRAPRRETTWSARRWGSRGTRSPPLRRLACPNSRKVRDRSTFQGDSTPFDPVLVAHGRVRAGNFARGCRRSTSGPRRKKNDRNRCHTGRERALPCLRGSLWGSRARNRMPGGLEGAVRPQLAPSGSRRCRRHRGPPGCLLVACCGPLRVRVRAGGTS